MTSRDAVLRGAGGALARMVVPFQYAYPVDAWIRGLKFRGEHVYGRVLGVLLARARAAVRDEVEDSVRCRS